MRLVGDEYNTRQYRMFLCVSASVNIVFLFYFLFTLFICTYSSLGKGFSHLHPEIMLP